MERATEADAMETGCEKSFTRLFDRCICGGKLLVAKELIWTAGGQKWREKWVCMDRKTTGCLSHVELEWRER